MDEENTPSTPTPGMSKEEINAIVQERLARQKASLTAIHDSEVASLQKEIADLKEAAVSLETKHKLDIEKERLAVTDLKTRYEAVIAREQARLDEQKKALPKEIVALLDKQSYEEQLAWLEEYGAAKVTINTPKTPPNPPQPSGNDQPNQAELLDLKRESGIYSTL